MNDRLECRITELCCQCTKICSLALFLLLYLRQYTPAGRNDRKKIEYILVDFKVIVISVLKAAVKILKGFNTFML